MAGAREDVKAVDGGEPADDSPIHTVDDYPLDEFDVDVVPGQRRGAHRVATPPLFAAVPWVLGGLFLVALIVVLITFSGGGDENATASATQTKAVATATKTQVKKGPNIDKGVRLLVLNGTERYRLDREAKRRLVDNGWIVTDTGGNEDRNVERTFVVYKDASLKATATALAKFLGGGDVRFDANLPEDMRVVIGNNFEE